MEFLTLQEQQRRWKESRERIWSAGIKQQPDEAPKTTEPTLRIIAGYTTCEYGPHIVPPAPPSLWRRHLSIESADSLSKAGYGPYIGVRHKIGSAIKAIKQEVCADRGGQVTIEALDGQGRTRVIVAARQFAMWRVRTELGISLPEIGKRFGNRDHTTVLHAVRTVEAARKAISE